MRKAIFALAAALILFATFSCNKDKNDSPSTVVGKWNLTGETLKIYQGTTLQSTTTVPVNDSYIEFNSDGTYSSKDESGEISTGTYTYDSGTKTLTDEEGSYSVTQLTSSNMTLHLEYTDDSSGTGYKYVIDVTLKK